LIIWLAVLVVAGALLIATGFTSSDADSSLYAGLSARLTVEPMSRWIAPEWWGLWPRLGFTGYYRDHPIGGFVLPAALARLGVPGEQAAYIVGLTAGLVALLLIAEIIRRTTSTADARAALVLLQLMPVAFVFRVRANQEYAMLVCLLTACLGLDWARRSLWGFVPVAAALAAALVIKGAFISLTLAGAGLWLLTNPTRAAGSTWRAVAVGATAIATTGLVAVGYDQWHASITGQPFWREYWTVQLSHVEVSTPLSGASTFLEHAFFYLSRLIWHPAPWSLALGVAAWRARGVWRQTWQRMSESSRSALIFVLAYAGLLVAMLSPSSRVAERYVFSATYAVAAAGVVAAFHAVRPLARILTRLDRSIPGFPAWLWLALVVARLVAGRFMPRL
jgi:4-amino-4-deoxy-L-arabinose transferase-like glycosyltransferase